MVTFASILFAFTFAVSNHPTLKHVLAIEHIEAASREPNWSRLPEIPITGRENIYNYDDAAFAKSLAKGKIDALTYPVDETGILFPWENFRRFFDDKSGLGLRDLLKILFRSFSGFHSTDEVFDYLGLIPYPESPSKVGSVETIPLPPKEIGGIRMGLSFHQRKGVTGFTFGCAACHSSKLFGKVIFGLTNRFPRANELFDTAKQGIGKVSPLMYRAVMPASAEETEMFAASRESLRAVGTKRPTVLGLDTSLAQVSLSMVRRNADDFATKNRRYEEFPREEILSTMVADSKPAVWWTLKYKNRWLSDGSIVSGNPIFTNFLWNEIGRGTDLVKLNTWLKDNTEQVRDLTAQVFATKPPLSTDFFPASRFNIQRAKRGQLLFTASCAKCHGFYSKAWELPGSDTLPIDRQLATIQVLYKKSTPVVNVGTDLQRSLGMESLAKHLNPLRISQDMGTVIEPQKGYVPPPLVGIWARYPYFHNNSVPSLCAVLTKASNRPITYAFGEQIDQVKDFDFECNGYPDSKHAPKEWAKAGQIYDTRKDGLRNTGHDEGVFLKSGVELFTPDQKKDLIAFLQTL